MHKNNNTAEYICRKISHNTLLSFLYISGNIYDFTVFLGAILRCILEQTRCPVQHYVFFHPPTITVSPCLCTPDKNTEACINKSENTNIVLPRIDEKAADCWTGLLCYSVLICESISLSSQNGTMRRRLRRMETVCAPPDSCFQRGDGGRALRPAAAVVVNDGNGLKQCSYREFMRACVYVQEEIMARHVLTPALLFLFEGLIILGLNLISKNNPSCNILYKTQHLHQSF